MKKWFRFFCLSFFSNKISKEGARRGYANVFLGFILLLVCLWAGFILGDMLPFGVHYNNSPDFKATAHAVFANADEDKRIDAEIENGTLKVKGQGGEYADGLLINTLERDSDRQDYSVNGYNIVVDMRPASTLAEVDAYCISNDDKNTEISYQDYLTLSDVARLNFDFKLRYTGDALELSDEKVEGFRLYLDGLDDDIKGKAQKLVNDFTENLLSKAEYNRAMYELYFESYYPEITEYEKTSKVPLLRNYYYHQYITQGAKNCLFIFDDCMTGSFETNGGTDVSFYGFYSNLEDGGLIAEGATQAEANALVDSFIKEAYRENWILNAYAYAMNVLSLVPFIALMLMVATLLTYSIIRLGGVEAVVSLGAIFKVVGSYVWFSGVVSAVATVLMMFFVNRNLIITLPLVLFFGTLAVRSIIFAIEERKLYIKQSEQQEPEEKEG